MGGWRGQSGPKATESRPAGGRAPSRGSDAAGTPRTRAGAPFACNTRGLPATSGANDGQDLGVTTRRSSSTCNIHNVAGASETNHRSYEEGVGRHSRSSCGKPLGPPGRSAPHGTRPRLARILSPFGRKNIFNLCMQRQFISTGCAVWLTVSSVRRSRPCYTLAPAIGPR